MYSLRTNAMRFVFNDKKCTQQRLRFQFRFHRRNGIDIVGSGRGDWCRAVKRAYLEQPRLLNLTDPFERLFKRLFGLAQIGTQRDYGFGHDSSSLDSALSLLGRRRRRLGLAKTTEAASSVFSASFASLVCFSTPAFSAEDRRRRGDLLRGS